MKPSVWLTLILVTTATCLNAEDEPPSWKEKPLASDVNGYNPVPSPDGGKIAFVRLAWGREGGSGGFGSSNLLTDIRVMDASGKKSDQLKQLSDDHMTKSLHCGFLGKSNGLSRWEANRLRDVERDSAARSGIVRLLKN
jgi:hypothetical protein